MHNDVFNAVWRSAMHVDQWFGSASDENTYMQTTGSLAPALLYDQFDGFQPKLRFQVDVPLPRLNEKFHAFIGRVNRDEYVTERSPGSGAFARQYGPVQDDETLLGIRYREPKQGAHFEADAGVRLRFPVDPFVKGSWNFDHGSSETGLFSLREIAFWQNTEKFGVTSRVDSSAYSTRNGWCAGPLRHVLATYPGRAWLHLADRHARAARPSRAVRRTVHRRRIARRRAGGQLRHASSPTVRASCATGWYWRRASA